MNLMIMMIKKISLTIALTVLISGCSITPGMHFSGDKDSSIYIESIQKDIKVETLVDNIQPLEESLYRIGNGDQIAITVWGLQEIFPITNISAEQNLRRVDSKGNIYFPYVGLVKANGKTQDELRNTIKYELSKYFNDPQVDVSIARFNSQKVYMLGEVLNPEKINLTDIPLSLSEALGEVKGLNNRTSDGGKVIIIRQGVNNADPKIIIADLSSPSGFLNASSFYLIDNDIVYINAGGTTRWNRVISQFFPFTTFVNTIDNLSRN